MSQPSPVQHEVSYPMEEDETVKHDSGDEMLYEEFEGDESDDGADDEREEITEDIDDDQCLQIFEEITKEDHSQSPEEDHQLTSDKNQIQGKIQEMQLTIINCTCVINQC